MSLPAALALCPWTRKDALVLRETPERVGQRALVFCHVRERALGAQAHEGGTLCQWHEPVSPQLGDPGCEDAHKAQVSRAVSGRERRRVHLRARPVAPREAWLPSPRCPCWWRRALSRRYRMGQDTARACVLPFGVSTRSAFLSAGARAWGSLSTTTGDVV